MSLAQVQRRFLERLFGDGEATAREAIYRGNVLANLHDALAATYPVVRRLVGEAFFREAAACFARAHFSRSGDLHRYGSEAADFLAHYPPARALAYLPDVARLEWACAQAFHAADGSGFDFETLARIPDEERARVRLRLHPAVHLIASDYPIAAIWSANQRERDGTPERTEGSERVLVHRDGFAVTVTSLAPGEWRLLDALARGAPLGELAADPRLAGGLAEALVRWTRAGVIDGFVMS